MARANREDARARVRAAASARHLNGPSSSLICIRGDYTGIEQPLLPLRAKYSYYAYTVTRLLKIVLFTRAPVL